MDDKQHRAHDHQPLQFDATHDGRARGTGCDARGKQFMAAEVKPVIGVYIGRVGRLGILSLTRRGKKQAPSCRGCISGDRYPKRNLQTKFFHNQKPTEPG